MIKKALQSLPAELYKNYKEPYQIYHAEGCTNCRGREVVGRIAIYEVLHMTRGLEKIILESPTLQKIMEEGKEQGMKQKTCPPFPG